MSTDPQFTVIVDDLIDAVFDFENNDFQFLQADGNVFYGGTAHQADSSQSNSTFASIQFEGKTLITYCN